MVKRITLIWGSVCDDLAVNNATGIGNIRVTYHMASQNLKCIFSLFNQGVKVDIAEPAPD